MSGQLSHRSDTFNQQEVNMYRKRISHIIGLSGALLALIFVVSLTYSVAADSSVNNSNIPTHAPTTGGAFIDNGTVQLGIHDEGHLNVGGGHLLQVPAPLLSVCATFLQGLRLRLRDVCAKDGVRLTLFQV